MKSGLVIYSSRLESLVDFYSTVLHLDVVEQDNTYALLEAVGFELVILETTISKNSKSNEAAISPREDTAIKPTFFIDETLDDISHKIGSKGGALFKPKDWEFSGRLVCDGHDCEGNVFQLRLLKSA
jgi:hypothetical protein